MICFTNKTNTDVIFFTCLLFYCQTALEDFIYSYIIRKLLYGFALKSPRRTFKQVLCPSVDPHSIFLAKKAIL
jgi:hypothetical protein